MKVVFCACLSMITLVTPAPTIIESVNPGPQEDYNQRLEYLRGRRSNQFAVVSPCAAAAAAVSNYHPVAYGLSGYAPYMNNYGYPYVPAHPGRVYRAEDVEEPEVMSFSDADMLENAPWARYNYGAMPAPVHYEAQSGPAYGVFPNANVAGCGMPLLVSCSPNVVQGRLVKADPHGYGAPGAAQGNGYRLNDHQDTNLNHQNTMVNDHLSAVTSNGNHDAVNTQ